MRRFNITKHKYRVDPGIYPILFATLAVALAIQPWRPLWNDEVLQFAFGAYSSTGLAWKVFRVTLEGINHSQTMAYIMIDYWLLRVFGASRFWFRAPSYLATVLLFAAALRLWWRWNLPAKWRVFGVLALYSSPAIMFHAGNARPYMPLVAATAAMLAFWSEPVSGRGTWVRWLGWTGMLTGSLFHPYFVVYAIAAWAIGFASLGIRNPKKAGIIRHLDAPLVLTGGVIYTGTGLLSWITHRLTETYDPWFAIGRGMPAMRSFMDAHTGVLSSGLGSWMGVAILGALAVIAWHSSRAESRTAVAALAAAGVISLILTWISWRSSYVIFPRQWVASAVLVALVLPGLGRTAIDVMPLNIGRWVAIVLFGIVTVRAAITAKEHMDGYRSAYIEYREPAVRRSITAMEPGERWILLANENTRQGGLVWPIFRQYYYLTGGGWNGFAE